MTDEEQIQLAKVKLRLMGFSQEAVEYLDSCFAGKRNTVQRLAWWTTYTQYMEEGKFGGIARHAEYWDKQANQVRQRVTHERT